MNLLISRLIVSLVIIVFTGFALRITWTKPVNPVLWISRAVESWLPVVKPDDNETPEAIDNDIKPILANATFVHSGGSAKLYFFVCEFDAINEGENSFEIVGFDLLQRNPKIEFLSYIQIQLGNERKTVTATNLPVYVRRQGNVHVAIIAKATELDASGDLPEEVNVHVSLKANDDSITKHLLTVPTSIQTVYPSAH